MKKRVRVGLCAVLALVVILAIGFYVYTLDYYRADAQAVATFADSKAGGPTLRTVGYMTIITPETPNGDGLVFYPGGKVEETAYLPLLKKLAEQGVGSVLCQMPMRLAVFGINRADAAFEQLPDVQRWFIGGHSLGGAMASSYAQAHTAGLNGLILLGAYPVGDTGLPTIAIYGSEDKVMQPGKLKDVQNRVEIPGGNHAWFGNYGRQAGDGDASITHDQQQELCVSSICQFMAG